jgi:GWxTD domain-containing protein
MMITGSAWRWVVLGWLAACVVPGFAAGAASPPEAEFSGTLRFFAEAASFPGPDGAGETFLYLDVPLTSLHFTVSPGEPPTADVHVAAVFSDRKGRPITGDNWTYRDLPGSLDREENEGRSLQRRYRFQLPAGETRVWVQVEEPAGGQAGELEFEIEVPSFADAPLTLSDLVFGVCGDVVASAPAANFEGPVLPHPSRRYGEDAPALCVFARVRDGLDAADTAYVARYEIKDAHGRSREKETVTVTRADGRGELLLRPRLTGLSLGRYRLTVEVSLAGRRIERSGWFEMDESRVSILDDAVMIRTVLGYVATNEELIQLEDEPADSLESIYRRFWERRDPTPDTRQNEALVEFMRRVDYATQHFGVLDPGWRSDMGRIYIKFGAPDQIESLVNDSAGPPTQIWYYYSRNATFVFQDLNGFGRYVLSSTRRN